MSTIAAGRRRLGPAADSATTVAESRIGRAAVNAIGLATSFIARRAERRLLRELDKLDDRLLDETASMAAASWRTSETRSAAAAPEPIRAATRKGDNEEKWS